MIGAFNVDKFQCLSTFMVTFRSIGHSLFMKTMQQDIIKDQANQSNSILNYDMHVWKKIVLYLPKERARMKLWFFFFFQFFLFNLLQHD